MMDMMEISEPGAMRDSCLPSDSFECVEKIGDQIISRSLRIDSVSEFELLLATCPKHPSLHRAFAEFLASQKTLARAAIHYKFAADYFMDLGFILQAMVAKIQEWQIIRPSRKETWAFHDSIGRGGAQTGALNAFLTRLSWEEMTSLMVLLVRNRYGSGYMVKRRDEKDAFLYFVVLGNLEESIDQVDTRNLVGDAKCTRHLKAGDFFGGAYPFDKPIVSSSQVKSITPVELLKVSKPRLESLCKKHPRIEALLASLCQDQWREDASFPLKLDETPAQAITIKMNSANSGKPCAEYTAAGEGLSSLGVLIKIECPGGMSNLDFDSIKTGQHVEVKVVLAGGQSKFDKIECQGGIAWVKDIPSKVGKRVATAIKLVNISEANRRLLDGLSGSYENDQDFMWNLWGSLI